MVYKVVLVVIVSALLAIQPSTSSPIENEKLVELSDQFNKLQNRMQSLETENEALKTRLDYLERKDTENEAKIKGQGEEIIQLKAKMDAKLESIQPNEPSFGEIATDLRSSNDNKINPPIYKKGDSSGHSLTRAVVPSSCSELSLIGHSLKGIYLVQNAATKKVETVLCTFGDSVSEDLIGQLDVKTKTVHFYVQRNSSLADQFAVIPFDVARVNEGGAFNLPTGTFTAPVNGIYHFDFSALKSDLVTLLHIELRVNGLNVGRAGTWHSSTGNDDGISLSASLRLAAGDRVNLYIYGGELGDDNRHFTHFTGWLVEEELM